MQIAEKKRFLKRERLTLQNDIEQLFEKGQAFMAYPLRVVYVSGAAQNKVVPGLSVLVGAPKKRIRQATSRNRIKRLIREKAVRKALDMIQKKEICSGVC